MSEKFVKLPVDLIGKVSERALILYALIADRLSWSKFRDAEGQTYCCFTIEEVADTFKISQTQAKQAFKELESTGLIIRKRSGQGRASKIYATYQTDGKPTVLTDGKPTVKTDGKPTVLTDGKPTTNQTNHNQTNYNHHQQNNNEICENQQTFDELFLMMTVKDVVAEILCQLVAKNPQEFAEINAEIINFVAENIRNAAENKKIANLTGYARAALRHAQADYDAGTSRTAEAGSGYGATYDIAAYESVSAADSPEWGGENYAFEVSPNTGEKQI